MRDFVLAMEELFEDLTGETPTPLADLIRQEAEEEAPTYGETDGADLEDQIYAAQQREDELVNIVEMLQTSGGVSRDMANSFRDVLPEHMALESFTAQVTKTNHVMCLEFVGTAVKLAAAAGLVALVGAIGYAIYRITKSQKRMPKNKLDKAVSAAFASAEEQLKVVIERLKHEYPDIEHKDLNWNKQDALVQAAVQAGVQELDVRLMSGTYSSLIEKAAPDSFAQAQQVKQFFESTIFPELEKMTRGGTGKDLEAVSGKLQDFKFEDRVSKHLEAFGRDMQVTFEKPEQVCEKFRAKYSRGVPADEVARQLKGGKMGPANIPEQSAAQMYKAQDVMTGLLSKIKAYEKKMEKTKELPADYVGQMKAVLQKCKEPISSLGDVFAILEIEIASQTRCAKIKGMAVADGFKSVSNHYQEMALTDKEHKAQYRACVKELDKAFDGIKSGLKL